MNEDCCETCRHWRRYPTGRDCDAGTCTRYPPRLSDYALRFYTENPGDVPEDYEETYLVLASHSLNVWFQPVTHSSDTCGEYAPAPVRAGSPSA